MDDAQTQAMTQELQALRQRVAELEGSATDMERVLNRSAATEETVIGQLQALLEISNELSMTDTVDDLCLRAVELGRSKLDFDRLGIWFRTDDPNLIEGSFGVDLDGTVCDERGKRSPVGHGTPEAKILLSKEPIVLVGEAPLLSSRGERVGHASQIFAALWDGAKVIGHISADNALKKEPLLRHQCEVLRLFGSVIGYLCTRKRIEMEREDLIAQLQEALSKIKTLHGLIPICCRCRKIRDDGGYWQQLEDYVHTHSDVDFSHGLCPECAHELYPDLEIEDDEGEGESSAP